MHRDVRHSGAHMKELGLHLFGRAMINVVLEVNHQGSGPHGHRSAA